MTDVPAVQPAAQPIAVERHRSPFLTLGLMVRLAGRELRGGFSGFGILIACIALGVAVIAGVGSLANALLDGMSNQGRSLIGGDIALRRVHQRASDAERRLMSTFGKVTEVASMRAMARPTDSSDQTLVEVKGVDRTYPQIGAVRLRTERPLDAVIHGQSGVAIGPALRDRLGLKPGDSLKLGEATLPILDVVESEPDKLSARLAYGPRVLISIPALLKTGLVQPGTIIDWRYTITLPNGANLRDAELGAIVKRLSTRLATSGFLIKDRRNPSERVTTALGRLQTFMSLLGLTALLLGGIGVASAASTYIARRQRIIATYRTLGATGTIVAGALLLQVLVFAATGVAIGLVLGAIVPLALSSVAASLLPFTLAQGIDPASLLVAAVYGFLVALVFVIWPLSRTFAVRPASLFRDSLDEVARPGWRLILLQAVLAGILLLFAIATSGLPLATLGFVGGTAAILGLFWALGWVMQKLARNLPRIGGAGMKIAVSNLASPDGLARTMILSLGAGLSLLVGLALVDHAMMSELRQRLPAQSPDYYVLDIPKAQQAIFEAAVRAQVPDAVIETAPMLRGRIVRLNGIPVSDAKIADDAAWVIKGDRGLTYAASPSPGTELVAGTWWDGDYTGPPLVSLGAKIGRQLGLGIGDTLTVNVLGRNITTRIANLRTIDWESLTINFIMIFSPNTLAGAPHNLLATVRYGPDAKPAADRAVARAVADRLPMVTMINVREAIATFAGLFAKMMFAVRIAGSITLVAGALVLAGALSAAHSRRTLQAVILKALGATRTRVLAAHAIEYALLTLATALLAIAVGSLAAWGVIAWVLELDFVFSWAVVALALVLAAALIAVLGGVRTWRILSVRPVPFLRGLG